MTTEQIDLCKLRSEDFARNFHSLREVEWHTTYQTYAGYAAVALAYWQLRPTYPSPGYLMWAGVGLLVLLFCTTLYLSLRHQERLHYTRDMQNEYLDMLHKALDLKPAERPLPKHQKWYAFAVQTILSAAAALTIAAYILLS